MYVIAIPSYKRAELLNRKTLKTLADYNIPRNRIFVFVANEEEEKVARGEHEEAPNDEEEEN